jgi:hypothetical protein
LEPKSLAPSNDFTQGLLTTHGWHIGNTCVLKKGFYFQSLVVATKRGSKALVESIDHIHFMNLHIEKKLQNFHNEIFEKQLAYINQTQQSMVKTIASLMQVMDQTSTWNNRPTVVSPTHGLSHA